MTDAHASPPLAQQPRATASGLVLVERHLFRLTDPHAPTADRAPLPSEDSPVTTGSGPDLALFLSALEDGRIHADLELWEHPAPEPPGPWDLTSLHEVEITGPEIALASSVSALGGDCVLPVPAGTYTLQTHCRGRAAAEAAFLAWLNADGEEDETTDPTIESGPPDGIERWLVRLWPAPASRATA